MSKNYDEVQKNIKELNEKIEENKKITWGKTFIYFFLFYFFGSFGRDAIIGSLSDPASASSSFVAGVWSIWLIIFLSPILLKVVSEIQISYYTKKKDRFESDLLLKQNENKINKTEKTLKDKLIELLELKEEGILSKEEYEEKRKDIISKHE